MLWTVKVGGGPSGVSYTTVGVRDKIYSFGGYDSPVNRLPIDVQVLNTDNLQWNILKYSRSSSSQLNDIPYRRYGHTAVVYNDLVYIWGGRNRDGDCHILCCFDTSTNLWSKPTVRGVIPAARSNHSACVINDAMYIFGGFEPNLRQLQDLHKLDLKTLKWSYIHAGGEPPIRRDKHSATVINDCMYIFGGLNAGPNYSGGTLCNEIIYLDTKKMSWIKPEVNGLYRPISRCGHLAFSYKDHMFVFGGSNGLNYGSVNDLVRYNPDSCSWSIVKPKGNGPLPRFEQKCCLIGDRVFMIGGMRSVQRFDDVHVLDFAPSLKTLAIMAVLEYKLDQDKLPETIQSDVKAMAQPSLM